MRPRLAVVFAPVIASVIIQLYEAHVELDVKKVTQFCELEWTDGFERRLGKYQPRNSNDKFKDDLTPKQQRDLEEVLGDYLTKYGYI